MRTWTFGEVKEKIKEEMDLQEETFVSEQEFVDYVNEAINAAEALIHSLYQDYFLTSTTVSLVSGTKRYALPSDIYGNKIRHIQYKRSNNDAYEVKRIRLTDKKFVDETSTTTDYRYDIENSTADGIRLTFYPTPQETNSSLITLWYLRNALDVAVDADEIDIPEFIEFIFSYIKVKIARKELNPLLQNYEAELEKYGDLMRNVLDDMIPNEDTTMPIDMSFYNDFDGFDSGSGF